MGKFKQVKELVTTNITNGVSSTKRVIRNCEKFVQAVSLLTVATFSYWALAHTTVNWLTKDIVLLGLIIIGLRGAYELVKFLDKE